jgi:tRNA modification GTPase
MVSGELTGNSEPHLYSSEWLFNLSAVSGEGFDKLLAELTCFAAAFVGGPESSLVTRARHRHTLEETLAALRRALGLAGGQEDLIAEELRTAAAALGRLTGRVDVEDILDVIFRDFCIGK